MRKLSQIAELLPDGRSLVARAGFGWEPDSIGQMRFEVGTGSEQGFCLATGQPVIWSDARSETRFDSSTLLQRHEVISGLCVAITTRLGPFGVLSVYTQRLREFTTEDVGFLQLFANMLAAILDRSQAEQSVQASLAEKEVLLKEIHHRVKNNLQIISSLLDLQSQHTTAESAAEMFRECQSRVRSMALVHERLYRSHDLAKVDFAGYIESLTDHLLQSYWTDQQALRLELDISADARLSIDTAIPCGLLLNELVSNCLKHAFKGRENGLLRIQLVHVPEGKLRLTVADTGIGLPEGLDVKGAHTFGLQLVSMLVKQLNGNLSVDRTSGTTFNILFPSSKSRSDGERISEES